MGLFGRKTGNTPNTPEAPKSDPTPKLSSVFRRYAEASLHLSAKGFGLAITSPEGLGFEVFQNSVLLDRFFASLLPPRATGISEEAFIEGVLPLERATEEDFIKLTASVLDPHRVGWVSKREIVDYSIKSWQRCFERLAVLVCEDASGAISKAEVLDFCVRHTPTLRARVEEDFDQVDRNGKGFLIDKDLAAWITMDRQVEAACGSIHISMPLTFLAGLKRGYPTLSPTSKSSSK